MLGKDIWLRFGTSTQVLKLSIREMSVGRFSNGDGNENVKKSIGLLSNKTSLYMHHTFFVHFFAITARLRRENA